MQAELHKKLHSHIIKQSTQHIPDQYRDYFDNGDDSPASKFKTKKSNPKPAKIRRTVTIVSKGKKKKGKGKKKSPDRSSSMPAEQRKNSKEKNGPAEIESPLAR